MNHEKNRACRIVCRHRRPGDRAGSGWGVDGPGPIGRVDLKNVHDGVCTEWKFGVTRDLGGWNIGLSCVSCVDTKAADRCSGASSHQPYCLARSWQDDAGAAGLSGSGKAAGGGVAIRCCHPFRQPHF